MESLFSCLAPDCCRRRRGRGHARDGATGKPVFVLRELQGEGGREEEAKRQADSQRSENNFYGRGLKRFHDCL